MVIALPLSLTKKSNHFYIPSYDIIIESNYPKKAVQRDVAEEISLECKCGLCFIILRNIFILCYERNYVINYDYHNA